MKILLPEKDPSNRVLKFLGVSSPSNWPKAASDKVSIFEAVQIVGIAKFGSSWDGSEFEAFYWPESPKEEATRRDREAFEKATAARKARSTWGHIQEPKGAEEFKAPPIAHILAWHLEQRQKTWAKNRDALVRLYESVNWLAQRCRDGEIESYARLRVGGHLWPMAASEWNVDQPFDVFLKDGGNKRFFSQFKNTGPFESYVFFDRDRVSRSASMLSNAPLTVTAVNLAELSPYLQLAVKVALAKGYKASGTVETAAVREAEIAAAWPDAMGAIPMTSTAVSFIARVMAFPNSDAIEQGRKAQSKRKTGNTPGTA